MTTVVGLFDNRTQAQAAIEQLRAAGIDPANISIAVQPAEGTKTTLETVESTEGGSVGAGAIGGGSHDRPRAGCDTPRPRSPAD